MAATVSQSRADVVYAGVEYENVTVVTRRNELKVYERRTGALLLNVEGIEAVEVVARGQWTVRFVGSDEVAQVTRAKAGCGCR